MGLLDWLSDAVGGSAGMGGGPGEAVPSMGMGGSSPMAPTPMPTSPPAPPIAPQQTASPPMSPADPVPPPGPGPSPLPPGGPQPDMPPPAPAPGPGGPGGPPPAAPSPPPPVSPGAPPPQSMPPPGAPLNLQPPAAPQQANGFLGRALGLTPNQESTMKGSLAEGLKSVGQNWNKPGLAAFAGSAGSAIGGGQTATDKTYDQKIKYLQQAIAAQTAGDKGEYNKNYAAYLTGKLKNETDAAADPKAGKSGAWNKPDSQKFIDAQHALANDPDIDASLKMLQQTAKTGEPADIAAAQAKHTALVQQKQQMYLTGVGLNPQKIQQQMQNPPGTQGNPHIVTSKEDFDQYVKPGDAFVNPKDGKVYIRKGGPGSDSSKGTPAIPTAPEAPGAAPGTKTEDDE